MTATHPTDRELGDFLLGKLDEADTVESHLADCDACRDRAVAVRADDTFTELLAAARTRLDSQRASAPTPTLDGASTPPAFAPTLAWDGSSAIGTGAVPPALESHPKYRPVRRLGTGGMGTVWLAEHQVMHRPVAVKVIRPDLLARPGATGRFLREVRAAAKLHHPNIVTAFDAEPAGDSCLLVMEYVPGQTLGERLDAGPLPITEALRAVRDAARGLAHAHAHGLVHRDVKPHNLIRSADGTTKVLDFGLAGVGAGEGVAAAGDGLTGAGMVVGTPDYIAPEQIADPHAADARADIYGLGCTLYHLLAGRPPMPDGTVAEKLAAQPTHVPDPIPDLPPGLAAVLAKMMAKRPEDRYQTADELIAALEPFSGIPVPRDSKVKRGRRRFRSLAIAAGILFGVAVGVVIKIERDNQVITVTTDDPDIEVVMKRKGEVLRVIDRKTGQEWTIDTDRNEIAQAETPGGLTVKLSGREPFVLRRAGRDVFTVTWAPRPPAAASDTNGLVRRTFTPGRDPLPVPARGPADAVTVVGDSWRIDNRKGEGNFNVLVARVADGLPKDGVLVFRAKVKVEGDDERAWGDLGFGGANVVLPSWDRWPAALARYDSHTREWAEKEVRYPAAAFLQADPSAVYLYAGLHGRGVLYLKDVELLYEPAAEPAAAREAGLEAAVRAAEAWLKLTDAGDYARAWDESAAVVRKSIPQDQYVRLYQELAQKNGKVVTRAPAGREFVPTASGVPTYKRVDLTYRTTCERSGARTETVVPVLEGDGRWRVETYRIDPPAAGSPPAPRLVQSIQAERRFPQTPAFTPDGKALLVAGFDSFAMYDPATGKELFADKFAGGETYTHLAVAADGRSAAVACGGIYLYDLAARKRMVTLPRPEADGRLLAVSALTLSPDGQKLAYVAGREVVYYDWATGQTESTRPDDDKVRVIDLRYSPDGRYLAVASHVEADQSTRVSLLDAKTRKLVGRHETTSLSGATLQFSRDSQQLFIAGTGLVRRTFLALAVASGKEIEQEPDLPSGPEAPVPSPDGRLLALTGADGTVQVWDRGQKRMTFAWNPHPQTPPEFTPPPGRKAAPPRTGIAFGPDGRTLATARGDQVRVWDLVAGPDGPTDPRLQGNWISTSLTATHTHVTFDGARFTLRRSDTRSTEPATVEVEGAVRLKSATDAPQRFQVIDDIGKVRLLRTVLLLGIYRLEGDTLFLCVRKTSTADDYPTKFATDPATGTELLVLKRAAVKTDAERLQGTWKAVTVMRATGPASPAAAGRVRLTFAGDQMHWTTTDGKVHEGTFRLDPGSSRRPKTIDLVPKQAVGIIGIARGVYSLVADSTGDTLTICIAEPRPGEAQDTRPARLDVVRDPNYVLMTLRREAVRADTDRILGTWRGVAAEVDGQPMPKAMIDLMKPTLTFTPDKVTGRPMGTVPKPFLEMAVTKGMLPRETAAVVEKGVEGVYHLDPAKAPKEIDFTILGEVKKTGLGIYELDGDTLKLCLSIDPAKVSERPKAFDSKSGEKRVVLTLRRLTPEEVVLEDVERRIDPAGTDGKNLPFALLEHNGVAAVRFGKWRVVFEGVPCDAGGKVLFGVGAFFLPGTGGQGNFVDPGLKRPAPALRQQSDSHGNRIGIERYEFKLEAKGARLVFADKTYEATDVVQTIVIARDGTTRLDVVK